MNIWVIIIAVAAGWAIGPVALQVVGAGLALMMVLLLATARPTGWATVLVVGGGGALMVYVGFHWKLARLTRYPTPIGVKARELAAGLILKRNPHSAPRRWLAGWVARSLGPVQVAGLLHEAERTERPAMAGGRARVRPPKAPRRRAPRGPARRTRRRSHREARAAEVPFDEGASVAGADWIDGTASEVNEPGPTAAEREAAARQRLRAEVDRVLEEARDCLERIIWALFVSRYEEWPKRLSEHRAQRRPDLAPIEPGEGSLHDRRLLFSVIAHDWTLISCAFKRDPSPAARRLSAIANRYAHEGPQDGDAADARHAFGEILDALRPQAIETAKGFMQHSRPLAHC